MKRGGWFVAGILAAVVVLLLAFSCYVIYAMSAQMEKYQAALLAQRFVYMDAGWYDKRGNLILEDNFKPEEMK